MKSTKDQVIGLSALMQASLLVDRLATGGSFDDKARRCLFDSLYAFEAPSAEAIYQGVDNLELGVTALLDLFTRRDPQRYKLPLRYAMSMINLGKQLSVADERLAIIHQRLKQQERNTAFQGDDIDAEASGVASLYQDTISTLGPRIQVSGKPEQLRDSRITNQIRALLLTGIRAAILWRQSGGRRWQLVFCKSRLQAACIALINENRR